VLADRGLGSPRVWQRIRQWGWQPGRRWQDTISVQPLGGRRCQRLCKTGSSALLV